jgi:hypothetical protein
VTGNLLAKDPLIDRCQVRAFVIESIHAKVAGRLTLSCPTTTRLFMKQHSNQSKASRKIYFHVILILVFLYVAAEATTTTTTTTTAEFLSLSRRPEPTQLQYSLVDRSFSLLHHAWYETERA